MGAWGYEIMASDNALDVLDEFRDICKKTTSDDDAWFNDLTRDELNDGMDEIMEKNGDCWDNDFWNVLAYQIVTTGADMPQKVRDNIDSSTNEDTRDWSNPEEREMYLRELRDAVKSYKDGQPVELSKDIGLLNKIYKGMAEGKY